MTIFPEIWAQFAQSSKTMGLQHGVLDKWHRNRNRYAIWVLRVDSPQVKAWLKQCQQQLIDWIEPVNEPHITVWVSGFPTTAPKHDDDVLIDDLERAAKELKNGPPIRVRLGRFNSFQTSAFIEIEDHLSHIAACRKQLKTHPEIRFENYVPHITLGNYHDALPVEPIRNTLRGLEPMTAELRFDSIDWVELDAQGDRQHLHLIKQVKRRR